MGYFNLKALSKCCAVSCYPTYPQHVVEKDKLQQENRKITFFFFFYLSFFIFLLYECKFSYVTQRSSEKNTCLPNREVGRGGGRGVSRGGRGDSGWGKTGIKKSLFIVLHHLIATRKSTDTVRRISQPSLSSCIKCTEVKPRLYSSPRRDFSEKKLI